MGGLCGGMCFTALDYFYDNRDVPGFSDPVFQRLFTKQVVSFFNNQTWSELKKWTNFVNNDKNQGKNKELQEFTRKEFEKLKDRIDAGVPTVIVLIRTTSLKIWNDHQVVAIGYVENKNNEETIYIYDPNHPGGTHWMTLYFNQPPQ